MSFIANFTLNLDHPCLCFDEIVVYDVIRFLVVDFRKLNDSIKLDSTHNSYYLPDMDNKEQDQLWDDNTDYKPLRRPNSNSAVETKVRHSNQEDKVLDSSISTIESATNNEDISNISNSLNDMVVNSKLRVEAKEWFPSTYSPTAPQLAQPAQSRLQRIKSGNSITMNEYNPETSQHRMEFDTVNLDLIIQSLIYDPGQFDNLVDNFIAILEPHFEDLEVAIRTAETIFEFALREPSFRYNAARLCSVLDEHYPLFRPRLHMLCEAELNTDIPNQGFTLFLAELYMQLHYQAVYGRCILDSLKKLVVSDEPDNIKSACQALKVDRMHLNKIISKFILVGRILS